MGPRGGTIVEPWFWSQQRAAEGCLYLLGLLESKATPEEAVEINVNTLACRRVEQDVLPVAIAQPVHTE